MPIINENKVSSAEQKRDEQIKKQAEYEAARSKYLQK